MDRNDNRGVIRISRRRLGASKRLGVLFAVCRCLPRFSNHLIELGENLMPVNQFAAPADSHDLCERGISLGEREVVAFDPVPQTACECELPVFQRQREEAPEIPNSGPPLNRQLE